LNGLVRDYTTPQTFWGLLKPDDPANKTICRCMICICNNYSAYQFVCDDCDRGVHTFNLKKGKCRHCGGSNFELITVSDKSEWLVCLDCPWNINAESEEIGISYPINFTEKGTFAKRIIKTYQ